MGAFPVLELHDVGENSPELGEYLDRLPAIDEHSCLTEKSLKSYWEVFHPVFPILHRPTFESMQPTRLLKAAMMTIGSYHLEDESYRPLAISLHQKCMRYLLQVSVLSTSFLCQD